MQCCSPADFPLALFSLFAVACTIGCVIQIYEASQVYFAYETVVGINIDILEKNELPAITICSETAYILDRNKVFQKYPWIKVEVNKIDKFNEKNKICL